MHDAMNAGPFRHAPMAFSDAAPGRPRARVHGRAWPRLAPMLAVWLAGWALVLAGASARAQQGVQFVLQADKTRVATGESFVVTLVMQSSDPAINGVQPTAPDFGKLQMEAGPSSQINTQIVNGQATYGRSFNWQLLAPEPGRYVIGPSEAAIGGQSYRTQPLTIMATSGGDAAGGLPPSLRGAQVASARAPRDANVTKALQGKLFLAQEVSKADPYVGQPIIVGYKLYKVPGLSLSDLNDASPDVQGAVATELQHARSLDFQRVQLDGQDFDVVSMLSQAFVPTKPGELAFDGYRLNGVILLPRSRQNNTNDPFGMLQDMMAGDPFSADPFFNRGVNFQIAAPKTRLNVRPLPEAGKPAGFAGTVGDYSIAASIDRKQAGMDDLLTLTVVLDGRGAIDMATPPVVPGDVFDVVGSSSKVVKRNDAAGIGGSKTFEFVLRARRSGKLVLPPIADAIFDPWKQSYRTLETEPIALTIAPGAARPRAAAATPAAPGGDFRAGGAQAAFDAAQLHYLKPLTQLRSERATPFMTSPWLWAMQIGALGASLGAWAWRRALTRRNPAQARRQGALRRLEKRLRAIGQRPGGGADPRQVAADLESAARQCIADRFNLSAEGLTREQIERLLGDAAMPEERVRRACDLLDQLAALRYAPQAAAQDSRPSGEELGRLLKEGLSS
jgi:hypothetical protein